MKEHMHWQHVFPTNETEYLGGSDVGFKQQLRVDKRLKVTGSHSFSMRGLQGIRVARSAWPKPAQWPIYLNTYFTVTVMHYTQFLLKNHGIVATVTPVRFHKQSSSLKNKLKQKHMGNAVKRSILSWKNN